ncbi:hypothetical protein [Methanocella paludicola]|nr:hypothetical protein [Methanocella paludicola]
MSIRKIAVLSMLVVLLIASSVSASAAVIGGGGISATSASTFAATSTGFSSFGGFGSGFGSGFGAFGGFGFPFNCGFVPFGVGAFPFNWALGGGFGPFPLFGWGRFSPGFFGTCGGSFPFSPCFMGGCGLTGPAALPAIGANAPLGGIAKGIAKASVDQGVPFILGSPLGASPVLGWDVSSWAFGLQSCVRSLPLYFGAHGFGFPFTLGNYRIGMIPSCGLPCGIPAPACLPAALPAIGANAPLGGIAKGIAKASVDQGVPFILGSPLGASPVLGWDVSSWAFGLQSCVRSLPLYFGAHGFGFPFTLGNYRIGMIPSCGLPCGIPAPACLPAALPAIGANAPLGGIAK